MRTRRRREGSTRCRRRSSPATPERPRAEETDWPRIAGLYAELAALVRSPIIELNRAVAVGMAEGPAAALAIVDGLAGEPALKNYHLLRKRARRSAFQARPLRRSRAAFEVAAALDGNKREQQLLKRRAAEAIGSAAGSGLNSDEAELLPLAPGEFRDRLTDDDVLEVVGLLMIGKGGLAREYLVEEEFPRLGDVLQDLEFFTPGSALRVRQKVFQKCRDRTFLPGIDLPECGDDQCAD